MNITGFSKYTLDGKSIYINERNYPLKSVNKNGVSYFFMIDDFNTYHKMTLKNIQRLVETPTIMQTNLVESPSVVTSSKSRGKRVLHKSTGNIYGSMKSASETHGISLAKLKSSEDFEILNN